MWWDWEVPNRNGKEKNVKYLSGIAMRESIYFPCGEGL
jgi:hypothetical protein